MTAVARRSRGLNRGRICPEPSGTQREAFSGGCKNRRWVLVCVWSGAAKELATGLNGNGPPAGSAPRPHTKKGGVSV